MALRQVRLGRHAPDQLAQPGVQSPRAAGRRAPGAAAPDVGRLAPDVGLDRVQRGDAPQRLGCHRVPHAGAQVQVPPGPAGMRPAGGLGDLAGGVQLAPAAVGVGLQDAAEAAQVACGCSPLRSGRVLEPGRRRLGGAGGPVVAHVDPQPAGLGLARPGASTFTGVSSAWTLSRPACSAGAPPPAGRSARRPGPPSRPASSGQLTTPSRA
jgi:hypothetical protein